MEGAFDAVTCYNGVPYTERGPHFESNGMSIDPEAVRAESHREIGSIIQRDVEQLLDRWRVRAIQEQPTAKRLHAVALLDHCRDFLNALGQSLANSDAAATEQHCLPATIHGEQRWETGWSLPEVVRDYQIFRLIILDYLEDALGRPPDPRAVMAIGLALDEAIGAALRCTLNPATPRCSRLKCNAWSGNNTFKKICDSKRKRCVKSIVARTSFWRPSATNCAIPWPHS
jgi:hypothetical protein